MSSRKSKKNKDFAYTRQGNGPNNGNDELSAVTFKYPGRFATLTRTILLNENLTIQQLLHKITLSPCNDPPIASKVFELYYMDEIYPFINKHAQETINTKKEIAKSWDLQTNHFQKIYIKRAEQLKLKWLEMKNGKASNYTVMNHHHHYQYKSNMDDPAMSITNSMTVIFKYYSVHSSAKTNRHIFITSPTKKELLNKIKLTICSNPPTAKELFEIYYYDEILPFLKKSGQQSIRGKKDLSKVWQIQTKTFKNLYEDRAKILMEEWIKMKKQNKKSKKKEKRNVTTPKIKKNHKLNDSKYLNVSNGSNGRNQVIEIEKIDCSLIRTLLNFLLFVECTTKKDCFMLLINDQNERYIQYNKFVEYLNKLTTSTRNHHDGENVVYFHIRVYIDNFDAASLRLHTGKQMIKLCFVNDFDATFNKEEEEELILFELTFNKLISGLHHRIDHQRIQSNIDDETRILSINVPFL